MTNKIYCPTCGNSREPTSGETQPFKICDACIEWRDEDRSHSEEDIQDEMQRNIDKTIRRSYR